MNHSNSTTRIFVTLLVVTLLLTYLALTLSRKQTNENQVMETDETTTVTTPPVSETPEAKVDTSNWKEYVDKEYPISFSYPANWAITTDNTRVVDYHTIVINPPSTTNNIYVYVSKDSYLALGGLKSSPFKIANASGLRVDHGLVGVKAGDYYYTFDGSRAEQQADEFSTLLTTVKFN